MTTFDSTTALLALILLALVFLASATAWICLYPFEHPERSPEAKKLKTLKELP